MRQSFQKFIAVFCQTSSESRRRQDVRCVIRLRGKRTVLSLLQRGHRRTEYITAPPRTISIRIAAFLFFLSSSKYTCRAMKSSGTLRRRISRFDAGLIRGTNGPSLSYEALLQHSHSNAVPRRLLATHAALSDTSGSSASDAEEEIRHNPSVRSILLNNLFFLSVTSFCERGLIAGAKVVS